jgi:hypothetical protein
MDGLLNKAKGAMSGGSSSGQQPAAGQPGAPAGGQKDYGDKGMFYYVALLSKALNHTQITLVMTVIYRY